MSFIFIASILFVLSLISAIVYTLKTNRSGYPPDQAQINKILHPGIKAIFDEHFKDFPPFPKDEFVKNKDHLQ